MTIETSLEGGEEAQPRWWIRCGGWVLFVGVRLGIPAWSQVLDDRAVQT